MDTISAAFPSVRFNSPPSPALAFASSGAGRASAGGQYHASVAVDVSTTARQLLAHGYAKLQTPAPASVSSAESSAPGLSTPTSEQSAAVIVGFIQHRLEGMARDGASAEQMRATFEQGLAGFQKGLEQAKTILQKLGALTDSVSAGIDETEQRVRSGLDELAQKLGIATDTLSPPATKQAPIPQNNVPAATTSSSTATKGSATGSPAETLHSTAAYFSSQFEQSRSLDLQIETRDGDLVTVTLNDYARSSTTLAGATATSSGGTAALMAYRRTSEASSQFSYSVKGSLDEGERKALDSLLGNIASLSDAFFSGHFDQAYNMAQSLQIDGGELSSMSLDLSMLTRASMFAGSSSGSTADSSSPAAAASPVVDPAVGAKASGDSSGAAPGQRRGDQDSGLHLGQVQQLLDLLDKTRHFSSPHKLLSDLLAARISGHIPGR